MSEPLDVFQSRSSSDSAARTAVRPSSFNRENLPSVCCVVLNWNGWVDTVRCIESLVEQTYPNLSIIIVDNASSDDSVCRIRELCPKVELIEAEMNHGFSGGCNLGIRKALAKQIDFVWLLNNDTIVPPETLSSLVAAANLDGQNGVTGSVLFFMHDAKSVQAWCGGEVLLWLGYVRQYKQPHRLGANSFATFASGLIRREVFEEIGLLDERYFMYYDDSDFCLRAREVGWRIAVATDTAILHKEGGSRVKRKSSFMEATVTTSGLHFLTRHSSVPRLARFLFVFSRLGKRVLRFDFTGSRAVIRGFTQWSRQRRGGTQDETR